MTNRDDDDLIAAEYTLGTLDPEERLLAARRRGEDPGFDRLVQAWEVRLSPLSEAGRETEPPAHVWDAILQRLGFAATVGATDIALGPTVIVLSRSILRWKRATALVSALAACLALVVVIGALRPAPAGPTLVAFLQKTGETPAYIVKADLSDRVLAIKPLDARPPPGRSYELWIIDPQIGPPKSLGVLDPTAAKHPLPAGIAPTVIARATYAVTEEQAGGSPTGAPTGSPLFVGRLVSSDF